MGALLSLPHRSTVMEEGHVSGFHPDIVFGKLCDEGPHFTHLPHERVALESREGVGSGIAQTLV